jgi:uncharacterized protein
VNPIASVSNLVRVLRRGISSLAVLVLVWLLVPAGSALAISAVDFPDVAPQARVLDRADLLSRAARQELERRLDDLQKEHIEGHLITLSRLDYGLDLETLAQQLANRWAGEAQDSSEQLVVAIDGQTITAAVAASDDLLDQLPASLLSSVGSTTMAVPLRQGARYRQASVDALDRLETVLQGGEDPGPPVIQDDQVALTNVPTKEETSESNAFTWVAVLLIVGTVVPMLTWWVFSR